MLSPAKVATRRRDATSKLRVIVLGYIVRGPIGGMAWHHLQYLLGLAQLGHEVLFVEDSDNYDSCYDPARGVMSTDPTYGLEFAARALARLGFEQSWAYFDAHRSQWLGPAASKATQFAKSADVLINVSGVNPWRPWWLEIPLRVLIDTDPAFTQIRHLQNEERRASALCHNAFFSFGENVGRPDCTMPDDGIPWQPTRQPIALDAWPHTPVPLNARFTTVMQWDSYPACEYQDRKYGMKSASFEPYGDLPRRVTGQLELCVGGPTAPRSQLIDQGWSLANPLEVTRDPWSYQTYIQNSQGEFSVAKQGYVVSQSGWFSERTACYLASGRPAVVQDTGFGRYLPTGMGLHAFNDPETAAAAIDRCLSATIAHGRAAREIAETYFDSQSVLEDLLARAHEGVSST